MNVRMMVLLASLTAFSLSATAADITLVKHARRVKPQGASQYTVKEGDTLRRILMDVYNAKEEDLPALYKRFRQDNPGITDLDYIPSGTKIVISTSGNASPVVGKKKTPQEFEVRDIAPDEYVIKQGEHLARIMRKVYGVSDVLIFNEYMDLIKKMNPEISDPNLIKTGQKIKLPEIKSVLAKARDSKAPEAGALTVSTTGVKQPLESSKHLVKPESPAEARQQIKEDKSPAEPAVKEGHSAAYAAKAEPAAGSAPQANDEGTAVNGKAGGPGAASDLKVVKGAVLPALKSMGGTKRDKGMYYMPTSGGTSLTINTTEIPVMELDTGKKIIFDLNGSISPEVKAYIEKAFPNFSIITGSQVDLEQLMDKVLSVSGYFSINKDSSPLLVGSEEKLRFFGKWIVYKDFSRRNVYVINLLNSDDQKTPGAIRSYAKHFGIDLIEIGGKEPGSAQKKQAQPTELRQSYRALFTRLNVPHEANKEIDLVKSGVVKISYRAPVLVGKIVLTDSDPDQDMAVKLRDMSYEVINTSTAKPEDVLKAAGLEFGGPPLRMSIAQGRTELEIPGLRIGNNVLLLKKIDRDIVSYLAASGIKVMVW